MKKMLLLLAGSALLVASCKKETNAPTGPAAVVVTALSKGDAPGNLNTRVVTGSLNFPWEIVWGPDNQIWFTERQGRVKKVDPTSGQVTLIANIPEVASTTNFNGLMGMALHPQFSSNPYVYLVYNYFGANGAYLEKVVRYTYSGGTLTSPFTLIDGILGRIGGAFIHNGARLLIGPDMKLYVTTGDENQRFTLPQNPQSLNGKTLRINLDGSIPADNPYGNAVWTIGHRNSQGLAFGLGRLYASEHGETTDDEINIIEGNRNYGWPYVEGFCDRPAEQTFCAANNVKEPIYIWTPTTAPSGMEFYDNSEIPQWKRSLLVTFLKDKRLRQMKLNATGTTVESVNEFFVDKFGRLRDVAIAPDGKVYISTDNGNNSDMIIEISKGKD